MRLVLLIGLGVAGAWAVVFLHSVVADAAGGAVGIVALVAIIRFVIRLAGEAGTPRETPVSSRPGSSHEATSRSR
jgi:hypothetical protein